MMDKTTGIGAKIRERIHTGAIWRRGTAASFAAEVGYGGN